MPDSSALVDVVVVSYNSRDQLRRCVEPLAAEAGDISVIVVDNDSPDRSLEAIADLPVTAIQTHANGGFAVGCNRGWRAGEAPFVLFLNPDARIDAAAVRTLARALEAQPRAGAAGPRIEQDGKLAFSQRRFPRLASTYAHALFLHRLFPHAAWASELVRDEAAYERPGSPEWISGAAIMVRRPLLERLGGLDEGFFLYCEDKDLCRRIRDLGHDVLYEPAALARHEGGASAPRPTLLPVLAASRVRYARKHAGRATAVLERAGVALVALTHSLVSSGGRPARAGHLNALRTVLRR